MIDGVEYTITPVNYVVEVAGPFSTWLHYRLMAFPGCQYSKKDKVWIIAKCRAHLVEIVVRCYLNNLSREDPKWWPTPEEVLGEEERDVMVGDQAGLNKCLVCAVIPMLLRAIGGEFYYECPECGEETNLIPSAEEAARDWNERNA